MAKTPKERRGSYLTPVVKIQVVQTLVLKNI